MKKTLWVKNKGWKWWHWVARVPIRSFGATEKVMTLGKAGSLGRLKQEIQPITEKTLGNRDIWSII